MVKNIRPLIDKIDSAQWINAIRNQMGSDFRDRVPEATQANLKETIENLWNYLPDRNVVEDALVNQLAMVMYRNTLWQNPLSIFKMGVLEEGETIEEVMVGLIDAIDYDFNRDELEKEIFGNHPIEVQSRFHKRNRKDRYAFTLNVPGLRTALLGNQLGSFVNSVMNAPIVSDNYDEYLLTTQLFQEFDKKDAFFNINVPDVADQGSDSADSRFLLRRLREMKNTLPFISRVYNPAGMPVAATPDELVLFTTAASDAAMDVEALAAAFNIDKADFGQRKIALPVEHFGIPGVQAILTTDKFFVIADNLIQHTSQFNPAKLTTNHWLHHWQTISASPFAPLIMFNSERESTTLNTVNHETTDIGAFTISDKNGVAAPTYLTRGTLYDIRVEGVTTPVGGPSALDLDISGQTSQFTQVWSNGEIYIGPDEDAETITITATATDNDYTESTTRQINGTLIVPNGPGLTAIPDADNDGLEEVTPEDLTVDADDNVTIPTVIGVQYKKAGVDVANGSVHHLTASTVFTAVARTGRELASGATASWTLAP